MENYEVEQLEKFSEFIDSILPLKDLNSNIFEIIYKEAVCKKG